MRLSGEFDFGGGDDLPPGCGQRRQLHAIDDPAPVIQDAPEWRRARDVANQLDTRRIRPTVDRDVRPLLRVERWHERHVPLQRLTAAGVHAANSGTDLLVAV